MPITENNKKKIKTQLGMLKPKNVQTTRAQSPVPKRGRPRTRTDDYYRLVAELHLKALGNPEERSIRRKERSIRERVTELLEEHGIHASEKTVAEATAEARRREYLTTAQKGKPDADPGPRLIAYWEETHERTS